MTKTDEKPSPAKTRTGSTLEEKDGAFSVSAAGAAWLKEVFPQGGYDERVAKVSAFAALARDLGTTPPRLALAWVLKNPNVTTAILGASKPAHLKENLKAIDDVSRLTEDARERVEQIFQTRPEPEEEFR